MDPNTIKTSIVLTGEEVASLLPHREEALYLFNPVTVWPGENKGSTTLEVKSELCVGHFPDYPIMPGHKLVEAVTQLLGVVGQVCRTIRSESGMVTGWEGVKFSRPARPGDLLTLEVFIDGTECRRETWYAFGHAKVTNGRRKTVATISKIEIASISLPG